MWPGVEPKKGEYDTDYLDNVENIVSKIFYLHLIIEYLFTILNTLISVR